MYFVKPSKNKNINNKTAKQQQTSKQLEKNATTRNTIDKKLGILSKYDSECLTLTEADVFKMFCWQRMLEQNRTLDNLKSRKYFDGWKNELINERFRVQEIEED